jgi:N-methylhydantoinase A
VRFSIGTDIGGTFTDCVVVDGDGRVTTGKAPSTPDDFSRGFFDALAAAAGKLSVSLEQLLGRTDALVHATTSGTNAVVERQGSRVGLITTRGHGEAMLIMRGAGRTKGLEVDDILDIPGTDVPTPIVPRTRIREVTERVDSFGEVVVPLDEDELRRATRELLDEGVDAIAVSFLWSFANAEHERRAREIIAEVAPGIFVSCGHQVASRLGEYYRTVATVMNSYIGPLMQTYTGRIASRAAEAGYQRPVLFAQCLGGAATHEVITGVPLYTLHSGPVSGIVASTQLGGELGHRNVITADMGGTTFDVSVIADGEPSRRDSLIVDRYEMYLPVIDVEVIGAGGGSIAWIDEASGTMKVGPRSAGADPGPLCYGAGGTEPTVTDADLVLGYVNPNGLLGGRRSLDRDRAETGIRALGERIGLSVEETAAGIRDIVDNLMAEKIRRMTVARGHDPREFVVYAYGGAGPMHAAAFSRELGAQAVLIPLGDTASVLSAMGTVTTDIVHVHETSTRLVAPFDLGRLHDLFAPLEAAAREQLTSEGFADDDMRFTRTVAMKYGAQVYDLAVPVEAGDTSDEITARFEALYAGRYGAESGYAPAGIEIIRLRLEAAGTIPRPRLTDGVERSTPAEPVVTSRRAWWRATGWHETPVWSNVQHVAPGTRIEGPAVIDLPDTTVPVAPGEQVTVDEAGNLLLTFG